MSDPINPPPPPPPPATRPIQVSARYPAHAFSFRAKDQNGVIRNIGLGDNVYEGDLINPLVFEHGDEIYLCGKHAGQWATIITIGGPPAEGKAFWTVLPCVGNEIGNDANNYTPVIAQATGQAW